MTEAKWRQRRRVQAVDERSFEAVVIFSRPNKQLEQSEVGMLSSALSLYWKSGAIYLPLMVFAVSLLLCEVDSV
jgi:hypothetical protein